MKDKNKKFFSLLTAATIVTTSSPMIFADNDSSTEISSTVARITASYSEDEAYVGSFLYADKCTVTLYNANGDVIGTTNSAQLLNQQGTPQVLNEGDNTFTVRYTDPTTQQKFETTLNVWGYKENSITTTYTGNDVLVNNFINENDVKVVLNYTNHRDGSAHTEQITNFTISNNATISSVGNNNFDISVTTSRNNTFTGSISVWGYAFDKVVASYKGNDILVGEKYDKNNLVVTENYTPYSDGTIKTENISSFSVNSENVTKVGPNEFTVTTNNGTAKFYVTGYEKEAITITGITATHNGKDIRVNDYVSANDVSITVHYSDGSSVNVGSNCTVKGVDNNVAPVVTKTGWNDFIVVYDEQYTTTLQVWGYDLDRIEATYNGSQILSGSNYNKADVLVNAYWTERKDGTSEKFKLSTFEVNSTKVENVGNNTFTATAEGLSDDFIVVGYDNREYVGSISANYKGEDILINSNYNKNDVEVTINYVDYAGNFIRSEKTTDFEVNSTTITKVENNQYTVTSNNKTATFNVWGYKEDYIKAEYVGNDILVDNMFHSKDVNVTLYYTKNSDGTIKSVVLEKDKYTIKNSNNEANPTVTKTGWNDYIVTYNNKTTDIKVWGYKADHIEATYNGPDILTGNMFSSNDVSVELVYTPYSNGQVKTETLQQDIYTLVNSDNQANPTVEKTGWNEYTVSYSGMTAGIKVWGYKMDRIEAEYVGNNIFVGNQFDSKDITVKLYYTPYSNGNIYSETLPQDMYTISNNQITKIGANNYTVTYQGLNDDISVWGYNYDRIEATYDGPEVRINEPYAKSNVKVLAHYTQRTDDGATYEVVANNKFTVNNDIVKVVGQNEFTATFNGLTDDFIVNGFDDAVYVDSITAKYIGNDILVGNNYDKEDVEVTIYYTDGTSRVVNNGFEVNTTLVANVENNNYTVTLDGKTATFKVWGYKAERIEAEYVGDDILVDNMFHSKDVNVTLYYTKNSDGTTKSVVLEKDKYTIKNSNNEANPTVTKTGWNDYTVNYKGLTDDIKVWGYKAERIEAEYNGPDILVDNMFASDDVSVKLIYTPYSDGTVKTENIAKNNFTISNPLVSNTEWNNYTVTYQGLTDDIKVWGYKIDKIEAEYVGPDILVNNMFASKDVNVTLYYTPYSNGQIKTEDLQQDLYTLVNSDNEANPTVKATGWNDYTVTYKGLDASIKVWGYKASKIEAEYNGPNILVGDTFKASDVTVKLIYTPYSDGTVKTEDVNATEYNVTNALGQEGFKILGTKNNNFTIHYNGLSDDISVWGYEIDHIEATYNGPEVRIKEAYNKADVLVEVFYTTRTDNGKTQYTAKTEDFEVDSLIVNTTGNNIYTASLAGKTDKFTVVGFDDAVYVKSLSAQYIGPDIIVGNTFKSSDVIVTVYYTDSTSKTLQDGYEITPFTNGIGPFVKETGWNDYTVSYSGMEASIKVWGYKAKEIVAEYNGPDVLVDSQYDKDYVDVVLVYTPYHDGTVRKDDIGSNDFTVDSTTVSKVKENNYTVNYNNLTDDITVWGYKMDRIEAEYVGPDVLVGNMFASKDVNVTLYYTEHSDGKIDKVNLEPDQYTLVNSENKPSPIVSAVSWNDYVVTYKGLTDGIKVWGYQLDSLKAEYTGPAIYVGSQYDKKDVSVTATYTPYSDGKIKSINVANFDVDSLDVTKVGANTYYANCEYGKAPFVVPGMAKIPEKTDNIFNIIAVDEKGNNIDGVIVKYNTNGYSGTLETGKTTEAKLGIGTVITIENCDITTPEKYIVKATDMRVNTTMQNSSYTLIITVADAPAKKTENVLKIEAVDESGNKMNGVKVDYSTNGHVGVLTTGDTESIKIGMDTVVSKEDCKVTIPDGYVIKSTSLTSETSDTNTIYTFKVVFAKKPVEVIKTENIVKVVATDVYGNPMDGVVITYSVGDLKGTLKTGDVDTAKLGIGTVFTTDNYIIGLPEGFKVTSNELKSDSAETHTVYTINVVIEQIKQQEEPPRTGDDSNIMLYTILAASSAIGLGALFITKKKDEDEA